MLKPLSFTEFQTQAEGHDYAAVFTEIFDLELNSAELYQALKEFYQAEGLIFEDVTKKQAFLCFETLETIHLNEKDKHPLDSLRQAQKRFNIGTREDLASFITSAGGFFSYDAIRYFADIPDRQLKNQEPPLLFFTFYGLSLVQTAEHLLIIQLVKTSTDDALSKAYQEGLAKLEKLKSYLTAYLKKSQLTQDKNLVESETSSIEPELSDAKFMDLVKQAKEYIRLGDVFQLVLSRTFKRPCNVSPLSLYQTLCQHSPSPFMFYLPMKDYCILGASPERFISVTERNIQLNPIAGTRKRQGPGQEVKIEQELLNDEKEIAEHMMLVDLARNDAGIVSRPGSVHVKELLKVKHFPHISHITSTVEGCLDDRFDAFDAFASAFPAGTLSGAPKIRAMELIDELEVSKRGLYGGAICRLDASGNLESCIAIRMAIIKDGMAFIRTGAGIVHDSEPEKEAAETRHKAKAMLSAIALAHGERP